MNIESHKRRIIVLLLMLAMVFTAMPTVSLAASNSSDSYDRISTAEEFISGTYVMVVYTGYAVGPMDDAWLSAIDVGEPDGVDKITNPGSATVEITVEGSSAKIKLSDGKFIAPKGGNKNGIKGLGQKITVNSYFREQVKTRFIWPATQIHSMAISFEDIRRLRQKEIRTGILISSRYTS